MKLEDIDSMIALYLQAERDLLAGKQITFQGRSVTSENLNEIRTGRQEWERRRQQVASPRRRPYAVARFT
ncbi:hypothetical protein D3C87_2139690 [compost metagenome]|uniref:Primosomal replication protein PriB/PriC domain protein n=3 Tax=Aeromonas TaxID=642 RepID=A0ABX0CZD0_9GAMM|nr:MULTISPECIES: hypothetical protein [Aeromonas]MBP8221506.1 hypothetical protein [Aeromonadaceae bacterium]NEX89136.1 hypothetical protein [Aeromonas rivipollensis]MCR3984146.1 hypothetical protein [Aeromonas caviae]MCV3290562.1 hypothetical protein [Aeromonas media]MCY9821129.1 hypothetical protein [Aeromonas media]